jgi:hypothetical protein
MFPLQTRRCKGPSPTNALRARRGVGARDPSGAGTPVSLSTNSRPVKNAGAGGEPNAAAACSATGRVGGAAGAPSSCSSLNMKAIRLSLPSPAGTERPV